MVTLPKNVLRAVTVLAAAFLALIIGSSQAFSADYPWCGISVTANHKVVASGDQVTINASNQVDCNWTVEFNGERRTGGPAKSFTATFTAPTVDSRTVMEATTTCDPAVKARSSKAMRTTCDGLGARNTLPIVVLAAEDSAAGPGANNDEDLPNTGGPSWYLLAGGLLLLVAGAGAVRASRRETAEVEES